MLRNLTPFIICFRNSNSLVSIELKNFKSFLGTHLVGPFSESLTGVIGPNGGGKSFLTYFELITYFCAKILKKLTINLYLMFSGKSNFIDAIAYGLCLPLLKGKHRHVKELVYAEASSSVRGSGAMLQAQQLPDSEFKAPLSDTMHVQLNFGDRTSLRRSYTVADQVNEYFFIDAKDANKAPFELPLT